MEILTSEQFARAAYNIRILRAYHNYSKTDLADRVGINRSHISHIEDMSRTTTYATIEQIAQKGFELSVDALFDPDLQRQLRAFSEKYQISSSTNVKKAA